MTEQDDLRSVKKTLRREILAKRDALSIQQQEAAKKEITKKMLEHSWYREAEMVLAFAGYGSELRTDQILAEVLQAGKMLFLPKIVGDEMIFYRVKNLRELQVGYKGIREPQDGSEPFVYGRTVGASDAINEKILMLMPGVAFDMERRRMGYGKGFYDRFLADKPLLVSRTIGIAHACQLVEKVPCEETDIRPAHVIYV
ncbi:MAG: 5-formyltetrahydrofolate cyclo-ligase [Lachnospiraceae bacterium]|nr:5-formyltetrahydrofolate cyclo-ligase [Lachnospiraceae bacterium]